MYFFNIQYIHKFYVKKIAFSIENHILVSNWHKINFYFTFLSTALNNLIRFSFQKSIKINAKISMDGTIIVSDLFAGVPDPERDPPY